LGQLWILALLLTDTMAILVVGSIFNRALARVKAVQSSRR